MASDETTFRLKIAMLANSKRCEKIRKRALRRLKEAARKVGTLDPQSVVRQIADEDYFARARNDILGRDEDGLVAGTYDPLTLFLASHTLRVVKRLDADITLVRRSTLKRFRAQTSHFLNAKGDDPDADRSWYAGLFETYVKATVLRRFGLSAVRLDAPVGGSDRNMDAEVLAGGRCFCVEATVLSGSNEDRARFRSLLQAAKKGGNKDMTERVDQQKLKCRLYLKLYEKLAPDLDPNRCQLSRSHPNILLVSIPDPMTPLTPEVVTMTSALDDLLYGGGGDFLHAWLKHRAITAGFRDRYLRHYHDLAQSPEKIGGLCLFGRHSLDHCRINYNASEYARLDHSDMALFEHTFKSPIPY